MHLSINNPASLFGAQIRHKQPLTPGVVLDKYLIATEDVG